MKKYIFSVLMAAMAIFTFSSCEDVPAPYTMPEKPADSATEGTPAGTGTEADPYNCAGAAQYCKSLDGAESTIDVYVKGKVQSIEEQFSSNYGNCSVTLVDEGTNATFKIWRAYYFDNNKWTEGGKTLNIGDEVVFCGKVINFSGNTPETVQSKAYLVSINGEKGTGSDTPSVGEAKGTGTEADPFNSVAANNEAVKLAAGSTTDQEYYIKGKIQSIKEQFSAQYGNASFMIADDETSTQFYIFRTNYFNGAKWAEGDTELKVGDEVVVCSKLTNYNGTLETAQGGKLISINGNGGSVTPTPDPTPDAGNGKVVINQENKTTTLENSSVEAGESITFDFTAQNYENGKETGTITLSDGTTIDFEANGESNSPKYYTSGTAIRVYKNNKIVITGSKKIAKIVFNCTDPSTSTKDGVTTTTYYTGNETATVSFSGNTVTYTNVFTGTSGGGTQVRLKSIEIVYAK